MQQLQVCCDSPGDVRMRARTGAVAGNREDRDPCKRYSGGRINLAHFACEI